MTSVSEATFEIFTDPEGMSRRVADWIFKLATAKDGGFTVCLSGGSTPRRLYEHLGGPRIATLSLGTNALVLGRRAIRAAQRRR